MKKIFFMVYTYAILLLSITLSIHSLDNAHFWRATNFLTQFYEPRLAKPGLTSFDATLGFGKSDSGRNGCGEKTELLNIYGLQNAQALGSGVPGKDLTNPADIALMQVALLPQVDDFGKLLYKGHFNLVEANFSFTQNLCSGFFLQAHIPVRRIKIDDIAFCDQSPTDCSIDPNQQTPQWQSFLALYPAILQKYGISTGPIKHTGVGDLSLYVGWTNNYEETQELDFVDTTFRVGIQVPTGKKKNEDLAFDIANGYNGYFAVPVGFNIGVGMYEWVTIGASFYAMIFKSRTQIIRMKTDIAQNGFIKLAKGSAQVTPGILWEANGYLKADHIICGLSLLLGVSFAHQQRTTISPCQTTIFDPSVVCSDSEYFGWKMSTFQLLAEYDFSRQYCRFGPRIGIFYNVVIGGERIFNTNMEGIQGGFDVAWDF